MVQPQACKTLLRVSRLFPLLKGRHADIRVAIVAQFAAANKLAIFSYWSFNRDFPGTDISTASGSSDQTSASQFFTAVQKGLGGGAPAT
jgi:hypothetical protein